jgi:hypothetical protein
MSQQLHSMGQQLQQALTNQQHQERLQEQALQQMEQRYPGLTREELVQRWSMQAPHHQQQQEQQQEQQQYLPPEGQAPAAEQLLELVLSSGLEWWQQAQRARCGPPWRCAVRVHL